MRGYLLQAGDTLFWIPKKFESQRRAQPLESVRYLRQVTIRRLLRGRSEVREVEESSRQINDRLTPMRSGIDDATLELVHRSSIGGPSEDVV